MERGVFVQVSSDGRFLVNNGDSGVVAAPIIPRQEGEEVDIIVFSVPEGVFDGIKMEGAAVLGEVTI